MPLGCKRTKLLDYGEFLQLSQLVGFDLKDDYLSEMEWEVHIGSASAVALHMLSSHAWT